MIFESQWREDMKHRHILNWVAAWLLNASVLLGDTINTVEDRSAGRPLRTLLAGVVKSGVVPSSESSSEALNITKWATPQRGWIYIVDSNRGRPWSRILVVDPGSGKISGEIIAKQSVDMALSPDGKVAYVMSGEYLAAVAADQGSVLYESRVENRERSVILGMPSLAVAPDGQFVYTRILKTDAYGRDENAIAVFDTHSRRFLSSDTQVPDNLGILIPGAEPGQLNVLCYRIPVLRRLSFGPDGLAQQLGDLQVPRVDQDRTRTMIPHPNDWAVASIKSEQGVTVVMASGAAQEQEQATSKWRTLSTGGTNRWLEPKTALSQNGQVLYVGSNPVVMRGGRQTKGGKTDRIHAYDIRSWTEVGSLATSMPFWSLALDSAANLLYAPTGVEGKSVLVVDLVGWRELGRIKDIAETPTRVIVVP